MRHHEIVIIGAGISGLSAASRLAAHGRDVLVLEKSRGVSGRAATRRWAGSRVDHGAQFFTARSQSFKTQVDAWETQGVCFEWARGLHTWRDGGLHAPVNDSHIRYACPDGMSALGKSMAQGVTVLNEYQVQQVRRDASGWKISAGSEQEEISAGTLVVSAPVVQSLSWMGAELEPTLVERLKSIQYGPSIGVVVQCEMPAPQWRGIQIQQPHTLSWIADDTSRRREEASPVRNLVLHGSADFSAEWQDRDLEQAADQMIEAVAGIVGDQVVNFTGRMVHRWRYALVTHGIADEAFLSTTTGPTAFFCGDAFAGGKIEGAWLSGQAVADAAGRERRW